jgi:hypothetical protein
MEPEAPSPPENPPSNEGAGTFVRPDPFLYDIEEDGDDSDAAATDGEVDDNG